MRQASLLLLLPLLLQIATGLNEDPKTTTLSRRTIDDDESNINNVNKSKQKVKRGRGIFDDVASGLNSLMSFATGGGGGAQVDTGEGGLNLVPNHCWYR